MSNAGPIFLTSVDGSRIGRLSRALGAHPNITITRRTNFWSRFGGRHGRIDGREEFDRFLMEMMSYRRMRVLQPDPELLYREFAAGGQTSARLFQLMQEQRAARFRKNRWADQSPDWQVYAGPVLDVYPNARMIHVIRDPRDVCAMAIAHRGIVRDKAVGLSTAAWLRSVRLAKRNVLAHAGRYIVVRYEEFAADPESFLRDICRFAGEDFSPAMLERGPAKQDHRSPEHGKRGNTKARRGSSPLAGEFSATLSGREIAFVQMFAMREMAEYGYAPARVELPLSSRFAFYLRDIPLNVVRMARLQVKTLAAAISDMGRRNTKAMRRCHGILVHGQVCRGSTGQQPFTASRRNESPSAPTIRIS